MKTLMIRYRLKPDRVAENERLVRAVYAKLRALRPPGFHYATFKLEDGLTFVHEAALEDDAANPLPALAEFKAFVAEIEERCDEPPATQEVQIVGSYAFVEPELVS